MPELQSEEEVPEAKVTMSLEELAHRLEEAWREGAKFFAKDLFGADPSVWWLEVKWKESRSRAALVTSEVNAEVE